MNKIALIGDLIRDIFIYGACERLNPEGPFPLIKQQHILEKNGGAGNVYENMYSLGMDIRFTLGEEGVMYCYGDTIGKLKAISHDVADVTGAGDCFLAAFVYGLTKEYSVEDSIKLGNLGAGISVKHLGTYTYHYTPLL